MTKKKKTRKRKQNQLILFLLDQTGSMSPQRDETIAGFNKYLADMQADDSAHYFMTLVLFNSQDMRTVCDMMPIEDVEPLTRDTYIPDHWTPLLDAIGQTIKRTGIFLSEDEDRTFGVRKQRVIMVIFTDGEENYSRQFNRQQVFDMVTEREKLGWGFVFLGANMDSYAEAGKVGIPQHATADFDQQHKTNRAFAVAASSSVRYSQTGAARVTKEERESLS